MDRCNYILNKLLEQVVLTYAGCVCGAGGEGVGLYCCCGWLTEGDAKAGDGAGPAAGQQLGGAGAEVGAGAATTGAGVGAGAGW